MFDVSVSRRSLLKTSLAMGGACAIAANAAQGARQAKADDAVTINLWHSMSGTNLEALQAIVSGFNDSQSDYVVVEANQGTYDESTGKFFNMSGGDDAPAIIQIGEQNLQSMIDSAKVKAASDLIDTYDFDASDLIEQAVNFYTVDGKMWAMPFNCSTPVVYYNVKMFQDAGVDEFPTTFEGLKDAADKVAAANAEVKPVGMFAYGYALDQMVTNMGGYVLNNENGRAERATEVAYQEQVTTIYNWVADLIAADELTNFGTSRSDTNTAFTQQQIAMYIDTSAIARSVIDNAVDFEVGVAYLPISEGGERQGVYAGGGALCTADGLSEQQERGVMAFYQYATSSEVQATWAGATGYYPISQAAYETQTMKDIYQQMPQLEVSAQQLKDSQVNGITAGPLCSQLPQLRTDLQSALENVFNGGDVASSIEEAVASTNSAIEIANMGVA